MEQITLSEQALVGKLLNRRPLDRNAPILITGAHGVLGNAVLEHFKSEGFKHLLHPKRNELDLLDNEKVNSYFAQHKPQIVIHLAATVFGLGGNLKNQMRAVIENTQINNNLFAALLSNPVERIFFAGTVASYPYPYHRVPLNEEDFFIGLPHGGEFGYASAKRHAYSYLHILHESFGTDFVYGIFTNLYGENDRFDVLNGHVIPSLIVKAHQAALNDESFEVWGDGSASRDFMHAKDAARAVLICLENHQNERLINISNAQDITIRQITEIIAQAAGVKKIHFDKTKPVGIASRVVNNQRLRGLGFQPSISIQEGLTKTYKWYMSHLENVRQ
jgi:GDP-L-fucose synthase